MLIWALRYIGSDYRFSSYNLFLNFMVKGPAVVPPYTGMCPWHGPHQHQMGLKDGWKQMKEKRPKPPNAMSLKTLSSLLEEYFLENTQALLIGLVLLKATAWTFLSFPFLLVTHSRGLGLELKMANTYGKRNPIPSCQQNLASDNKVLVNNLTFDNMVFGYDLYLPKGNKHVRGISWHGW